MWKYNGEKRPPFAQPAGQSQQSVWDYPRPPRIVQDARRVQVGGPGGWIADTHCASRVLETASPPTFYLPPEELATGRLIRVAGTSFCEWKGEAIYWALVSEPARAIAWSYPSPTVAFADLQDWLAFYPGRIPCYVDSERVRPQSGEFYGGWVTDEIVGPWKGAPASGGW